MDKKQAQALIKGTFESTFDKDRFIGFVKNLLNDVKEAPFIYRGNFIPDAYEQYINTLERVGKYNDGEHKIDVLIAKLKKATSIERARTMQRNFVAWYLNGSRGGELKDGALVAFVAPNEEDWRFSLVKMDYRFEESKKGRMRVKEEFTPARRWSFLVGINENSHTAQSQLVDLVADDERNPVIAQLEEAFNIEKVTKEFFEKYRELFLWTKETLEAIVKKDKKIRDDFKAKGVNPVDFSKKLLGQIVFLYFLQKKGWFGVKRDADWGTGPKNFLRELFEKKHGTYNNFFNDVLEPLFYEALRIARSHDDDYYSKLNCRIPFLNGGLFDPINSYDWVHTDILLPDDLFSNSYKTKEGDKGNGILDIFDRYNFTVKEDEPLEKEVAVDPEMLGKVFETLLEVKDRKSKGTYYTPREIVHYMCQQSLINYLATELEGKVAKEDVETLIEHGEHVGENETTVETKGRETSTYFYKLPESIRQNAALIDKKLVDIKVCDPAIGSGAFPVGMMGEIVKTRNVLSAYIKVKDRTIYTFKRECIEKSLYGVDIDSGAVEIAKLRLWLSLVVDEDDIKQIKPLPNLDYKIVCGNSLLGVEKDLFNSHLFRELERLKPLLFGETNPKKKQERKKQIDDIIRQITNGHKEFDFEVYFSEVFHEKKGFDVIIANPPYVDHKKLKSVSGHLKQSYKTYSGTADLYVYFYEKGLNVLKKKGVLAFISSNKFIKTSYGENLRNLLSSQAINQIIDFTKVHVFDALVASCVVIVSKNNPLEQVIITDVDDTFFNEFSLSNFIRKRHRMVPLSNLRGQMWQFDDDKKLRIKSKIETDSTILSRIEGVNIFRGITTGHNPAFIIDEGTKNKFTKMSGKYLEIIKPLLQGRNIRKWFFNESNLYLLQTGYDRNIKIDFPYIYLHLVKHEKQLKIRDDQGKNWWNLRSCKYYGMFEKEKVIWGLTANKWAFAYDSKGHYLPSNGYILTSERNLGIKYILALLNSTLLKFYFGFIGIMTAGGAYTLKHETISAFPIKEIPKDNQKHFINLVDCILVITKDDNYIMNSAKQAKVKEYERQIDQMVYKLYGLTEEEIEIVENL